jgi:quinol monooxygenase YgiN
MPVLVTMRVKIHDFEGTKKAAVLFAETGKKAGCHWAKVYRSEKDPNVILWLMEWESHEAFNKSGDESGEQFNELVNPAGEWDDVLWHLSDSMTLE